MSTRIFRPLHWASQLLEWLPTFLFPLLLALLFSSATVEAGQLTEWEGTYWCKCICFSNYTILPLLLPDSPSKPCLTCSRQWCLDQHLIICKDAVLGDPNPDTATGKEGDVEARCFQRDSPRDQLVVTLFLLIVFGLLIGAAVKGRMAKVVNWNTGTRRWWEAWLPSREQGVNFDLGSEDRGTRQRRQGGYVHIDT